MNKISLQTPQFYRGYKALYMDGHIDSVPYEVEFGVDDALIAIKETLEGAME